MTSTLGQKLVELADRMRLAQLLDVAAAGLTLTDLVELRTLRFSETRSPSTIDRGPKKPA